MAGRVDDEIAFGMEQLGIPPVTMRKRVEEVLDLLGIAALRDREIATLGWGTATRGGRRRTGPATLYPRPRRADKSARSVGCGGSARCPKPSQRRSRVNCRPCRAPSGTRRRTCRPSHGARPGRINCARRSTARILAPYRDRDSSGAARARTTTGLGPCRFRSKKGEPPSAAMRNRAHARAGALRSCAPWWCFGRHIAAGALGGTATPCCATSIWTCGRGADRAHGAKWIGQDDAAAARRWFAPAILRPGAHRGAGHDTFAPRRYRPDGRLSPAEPLGALLC